MRGKRLYQQVVEQILELIDSGEYPAGTKLPTERELAERFGVSRPTIREAVIALEAIQRVAVKTGSGMYVSGKKHIHEPSSDISPFELIETRVLVEGEAAALAATLITGEQLQALQHELSEMAKENTLENLGTDSADRNFHLIIAAATNNRMLEEIIRHLWDTQDRLDYIRKAHQELCKQAPETSLNEHRAIYDALQAGNPQRAEKAMRQHFTRILQALHTAVEKVAVEAVQRKLSLSRDRFSARRLLDSSGS